MFRKETESIYVMTAQRIPVRIERFEGKLDRKSTEKNRYRTCSKIYFVIDNARTHAVIRDN